MISLDVTMFGSNLWTVFLLQVGIALKPFLPQLQTTFLKALQDTSRGVRLRAAEALGQLVSIHTKVDPLFTEQLSAIRNAEDAGVRWALIQQTNTDIFRSDFNQRALSTVALITLFLEMEWFIY